MVRLFSWSDSLRALTSSCLNCLHSSKNKHNNLEDLLADSGSTSATTAALPPKTRLISQESPVDPSVILFKLENSDGNLEPGPSTPPCRSKRVKVEEVVEDEEVVDGEFPVLDTKVAPAANIGKGKKARTGRTPSASPQKPKAIKQALDKPHPAPEGWRETYDSIKEMRSQFPAPVDTMGCDTAKWKEMDPRVRDTLDALSFLVFLGSDLLCMGV
jgi:endonuclease III